MADHWMLRGSQHASVAYKAWALSRESGVSWIHKGLLTFSGVIGGTRWQVCRVCGCFVRLLGQPWQANVGQQLLGPSSELTTQSSGLTTSCSSKHQY